MAVHGELLAEELAQLGDDGRVVEVENFGSLTRAFLLPAVDGRGLQSVVVLRTDKARLVKRERKA